MRKNEGRRGTKRGAEQEEKKEREGEIGRMKKRDREGRKEKMEGRGRKK